MHVRGVVGTRGTAIYPGVDPKTTFLMAVHMGHPKQGIAFSTLEINKDSRGEDNDDSANPESSIY